MDKALSTDVRNTLPADERLEAIVVNGDLSKLTPQQRSAYYKLRCDKLGLDWTSQPFGYVQFKQGGLKLFPLREATEQLRNNNQVSIAEIDPIDVKGCIAFKCKASLPSGRTDFGIGAVSVDGLEGQDYANAVMKAETKAKKRATLSLLGLGMPSDDEVRDTPGARIFNAEALHRERPLGSTVTATVEPVQSVSDAKESAATSPIDIAGAYVVQTKCSFRGKMIRDLYADAAQWKLVEKILSDEGLKRNLDKPDIAAFDKFLTLKNGETTNA